VLKFNSLKVKTGRSPELTSGYIKEHFINSYTSFC
jgi:hypothetical protein